jgi:hypothetical protein
MDKLSHAQPNAIGSQLVRSAAARVVVVDRGGVGGDLHAPALIGGGAEPRTDGCRIGDVRHGSTKRVASSVVLTLECARYVGVGSEVEAAS